MSNTSWFKKSIIYHILIDRFAGFKSTKDWDKPVFLGGNIQGIIKKIKYLEELGINTIWISPFNTTNSYHGYHITNFYKVDPHFGNEQDLNELIKKAHSDNIKIIADFVPNHCSKYHPKFIKAQKEKKSEYKEWFLFKKWPNNYICFLNINDLPKINLENYNARNHIIGAAKHWLEFGLDGYRLDHVIGPKHSFWRIFKNEIKKEYPQAVLIGEAWMKGIRFNDLKTINPKRKYIKWFCSFTPDSLLKEYHKELDGVLDFRMQEIIKQSIVDNLSNESLKEEIKKHYGKFKKNYYLPIFLDNHDMNRFLFSCGNKKGLLKKAAKIQFNQDQPPIIYYGTEVCIKQEKSIWSFTSHGDLQARQPMIWKNQDKHLLLFYKKLIQEKLDN